MRDYVRLNARVESDLADQRKLLEQERKDRQERVRLAKEERGDFNGTTTTTTTTTMMDSRCQGEGPATPRRVPHTPVEEETSIPGTVDDSADRVTSLAGLVNYVELDAEYDNVSIATKSSRERIEPPRPASASSVTGAVREQLELEGRKLKKRKSLLRRSNKTSPAPLGELTLSLGSNPRITLPPLQPRRQQPLSAPSNYAHVRQGSVWGLTKSLDIVLNPSDPSSAEHQDSGIDGKSTKDCVDLVYRICVQEHRQLLEHFAPTPDGSEGKGENELCGDPQTSADLMVLGVYLEELSANGWNYFLKWIMEMPVQAGGKTRSKPQPSQPPFSRQELCRLRASSHKPAV
uniref:Uncharacterized protein n=1 Tax=Timema genevievae TaxID=629358 RepID=A0A7R9K1U2_TIMGE|nr:unnamed protein product [Timema genevievae]